jgi:hypothetical protein
MFQQGHKTVVTLPVGSSVLDVRMWHVACAFPLHLTLLL